MAFHEGQSSNSRRFYDDTKLHNKRYINALSLTLCRCLSLTSQMLMRGEIGDGVWGRVGDWYQQACYAPEKLDVIPKSLDLARQCMRCMLAIILRPNNFQFLYTTSPRFSPPIFTFSTCFSLSCLSWLSKCVRDTQTTQLELLLRRRWREITVTWVANLSVNSTYPSPITPYPCNTL